MKKILISCIVIVAFVSYSLYQRLYGVPTTPIVGSKTTNSENSLFSPIKSTNSPSTDGTYKDGTYTGAAEDAFYGMIQVQATISSGKITAVKFLQYPNDRDTSAAINQASNPILTQEAIQAQSAQVDVVSGATDSSQAFVQSLQSALDQAKS